MEIYYNITVLNYLKNYYSIAVSNSLFIPFHRLYDDEAYINEHLAIFHPSFIDECVRTKSIEKISIGQFLLPPAELRKRMF